MKKPIVSFLIYSASLFFWISCNEELPTFEAGARKKPLVSLVFPSRDTVVVDSVDIEVDASDDERVVLVEIYIDFLTDSTFNLTAKPYRRHWDVRTLPDSSTHSIFAKAYDNDGNFAASSVVDVLVRTSSFPPPTNLQITFMTNDTAYLQWQDNSDFETGFEIQRNEFPGRGPGIVKTVGSNVTTTAVPGPYSPVSTYDFNIRAVAGQNKSRFSNTLRAYYATELYAGGQFSTAGGLSANSIARWNGATWSPVGMGMNNSVDCLTSYNSELYAGGTFTLADGAPANYIAKWNGMNWTQVGSGMSNRVHVLLTTLGVLYAGGRFRTAGGLNVNNIAKWDGTRWFDVGGGVDFIQPLMQFGRFNASATGAIVYALLPGGVYVGGLFNNAGGTAVSNIAQWNGVWLPMGSGMNTIVYSLIDFGNQVYAGGEFTIADGSTANYVAKWNGTLWSPVDSGMNAPVYCFGVYAGELYTGGAFTTAGGVSASYIAKWNGSTWSAVGAGVDAPVYALFIDNNELYVGGAFSMAGGTSASYIAKWDGTNWANVGTGTNGPVNSLFAYGDWRRMNLP